MVVLRLFREHTIPSRNQIVNVQFQLEKSVVVRQTRSFAGSAAHSERTRPGLL